MIKIKNLTCKSMVVSPNGGGGVNPEDELIWNLGSEYSLNICDQFIGDVGDERLAAHTYSRNLIPIVVTTDTYVSVYSGEPDESLMYWFRLSPELIQQHEDVISQYTWIFSLETNDGRRNYFNLNEKQAELFKSGKILELTVKNLEVINIRWGDGPEWKLSEE